jgi:hypothetical protein
MSGEAKMNLIPQKQVVVMALPDDHYKRIKKMVRKQNGTIVLSDKAGVKTAFLFIDGQLKAYVGDDNEPRDVIPLSEATKPSDDYTKMRELVISKNPGADEDTITAATDVLIEGINSAKRLVEMGVPFDKARQIVALALQDETGNANVLNEALLHHLSAAPETAPPKDCE